MPVPGDNAVEVGGCGRAVAGLPDARGRPGQERLGQLAAEAGPEEEAEADDVPPDVPADEAPPDALDPDELEEPAPEDELDPSPLFPESERTVEELVLRESVR